MLTRRSVVAMCGALLGLALGAGTVSATWPSVEYLTFNRAVGLPGITLGAGSYSFEIIDTQSSSGVVCVRDRATRRPLFLGLTQRVERPAGSPMGRSVVFGEAPRGMVPPIVAWYPNGDSTGRLFLYR